MSRLPIFPNVILAGNATDVTCPLTRSNPHGAGWCVGASCAAWVWTREERYATRVHVDAPQAVEEPERPPGVPEAWSWCPYDPDEGDPACWLQDDQTAERGRPGRCGLVPTS